VDDRIRQGFLKCQVDFVFLSRRALHFCDDLHHATYDGPDRPDVGVDRTGEANKQLLSLKITSSHGFRTQARTSAAQAIHNLNH
jgi:hypothetical protein